MQGVILQDAARLLATPKGDDDVNVPSRVVQVRCGHLRVLQTLTCVGLPSRCDALLLSRAADTHLCCHAVMLCTWVYTSVSNMCTS